MKEKIFNDCLEYYQNSDGKTPFWESLAIKYKEEGYGEGSKEKLRRHFHAERKTRGIEKDTDPESYKETYTKNKDGSESTDKLVMMSEEEMKDDNRIMVLHGFDPKIWEVVHCISNRWHMSKSHKIGGGRLLQYQSKLTVKRRVKRGVTFEDVEKFFKNYKGYTPPKIKHFKASGNKALFVALGDLHFGNRSVNNGEMGIEDKFTFTANRIIKKVKNVPEIEEIVLATLGDIGHWDGVRSDTTGGTRLDSDGSTYQEIFNSALKSLIWLVEELLKLKINVRIPYIAGNHDEAFGWYLIRSLEMYFRNSPNVIIDSSSDTRKVIVYGNTMIGLTHGNMSKKNQKSWILSYRKEIGVTTWTEILQGHVHHTVVQEENGMIIRNVPAMAGTDKWHYDNGFVGASKATECFLYDKEYGQEEIWRINI